MLKPKLGYTPSTTLTFKTSLGAIYFSEALNTVGDVTDAKKKHKEMVLSCDSLLQVFISSLSLRQNSPHQYLSVRADLGEGPTLGSICVNQTLVDSSN